VHTVIKVSRGNQGYKGWESHREIKKKVKTEEPEMAIVTLFFSLSAPINSHTLGPPSVKNRLLRVCIFFISFFFYFLVETLLAYDVLVENIDSKTVLEHIFVSALKSLFSFEITGIK